MVSPNAISHSRNTANPPRLSIGLPVYNGARFLAEALDSLLAQTYADFELIISDNGSVDATQSICEQYAALDQRIRYVRQEINHGLAWNWNRVFELSSGAYFKWAACDDLYHPTFLARCLEILERNPKIAWCHTLSRHIDPNGLPVPGEEPPEISHVNVGDIRKKCGCRTSARLSDRFKAVLLGRNGLDCYGVIRSEILRKTALFLPYYGAEKIFMAELALRGQYYEVPEVLSFARLHQQAVGNLRSQRQQRHVINPFTTKWHSTRFGLLCGYFGAIKRAGLPSVERFRCYCAISQYLMQVRKWKSVLKKAMTGAGLAQYPSAPVLPSQDSPMNTNSKTRYALGK
jgi:glycosyltransferase involved in cell wall biosynthesis